MKLHVDIIHLCHINFFKQAIEELSAQGHTIILTYLNRGKIAAVLKKELPQFTAKKIGTYQPTTVGKVFMTIDRTFKFLRFLLKEKPDVTSGVGDFVVAFASRLQGIRSVQFYDDYEFKQNYLLTKWFAHRFVIPKALPTRGKKIRAYRGYKELAYVGPAAFRPSAKPVAALHLKNKRYVFAREVAGITMNYKGLEQTGLLPLIQHLHHQKIPVILSLEDKKLASRYAPYAHILKEPVNDIYSLMAGAIFMISSGDSMARESALLGVPALYTGGRSMAINKPLIRMKGIRCATNKQKQLRILDELLLTSVKQAWKKTIKKAIASYENTTSVIIEELSHHT